MDSPDLSELDVLRALCERQQVTPDDADLKAVQGFLHAILPALGEIEAKLPADIGPLP